VSHLIEEGRVGYTKGLVTETIRFTKCFKGNVHVVPFLPPPLGGMNDPELIRGMLDVLSWMEKLQKWDLSSYFNAYRAQIYATGSGPEQAGQNTQRHKLPKAYEAYNDKVFICHPWTGIGLSLPAMNAEAERIMLQELLEGLAVNFKWELDTRPTFDRMPAHRDNEGLTQSGTEVLLLGEQLPAPLCRHCRTGSRHGVSTLPWLGPVPQSHRWHHRPSGNCSAQAAGIGSHRDMGT
jgi:hypothetical protein